MFFTLFILSCLNKKIMLMCCDVNKVSCNSWQEQTFISPVNKHLYLPKKPK